MDEQPLTPAGDPEFLGTTLGGRYRLRAVLGRGGMGEVYEADDLRLHRPVAVKLLRPDLERDPRVLERFRREARTAGSLMHPNIVAVHDVGSDGGRSFLVMELVRGHTLAEVIRSEAPLAPGRAARIAARVAEALEFAHGHGVVHRDVAPGNVMLTDTGEVKVLDFGIAHADLGSTGPSSVRGTLAYVAPEIARGLPADARSDVYALGAVLSELLTGVPPHGDATPDLPAPLGSVVRRCLAEDPRDRFARACELADALASAMGEAPQTRPLPADPLFSVRSRGPTTPELASAPTLPLPPRVGAGAQSGRGRRWAVAAATVAAGLAAWFVVLPVWHAMSDPPAQVPVPAAAELRAPVGVSATGTCDGFWNARIDLAWRPATTPAAGFEIYRADETGGPFRLVQRVDGGVTTWTDRGLGLDDSYRYLLRAVDGDRRSPLTPELPGSTPLVCLG
jgi:serine/threonine-protein kinase